MDATTFYISRLRQVKRLHTIARLIHDQDVSMRIQRNAVGSFEDAIQNFFAAQCPKKFAIVGEDLHATKIIIGNIDPSLGIDGDRFGDPGNLHIHTHAPLRDEFTGAVEFLDTLVLVISYKDIA